MITRRRVGQLLVASTGAVLPSLALSLGPLEEGSTVISIGRCVVANVPELANRHAALKALHRSVSRCADDVDPSNLWTAVMRSDFARGETVLVDGWQLSRAEAAYCALAFLDQDAS